MNFIEAREQATNNLHSIIFVRKNDKEIVFKCEKCQGEMKRKEVENATWEGPILKKKCSKAPKHKKEMG
ncbi:MAG: hypothetical protein HQL32_03435 [Planctomycetes bacterium]|nr:hypothetical protein [Planctomycetota bacterium]